MKKKWIVLGVFVFIGLCFLQMKRWRNFQDSSLQKNDEKSSSLTSKQEREEESSFQARNQDRPKPASQMNGDLDFSHFQEKYGKNLEAFFGRDQQLLRIQGNLGHGVIASPDFKPSHEGLVRKRAQDVLLSAKQILKLNPDSPLQIVRVNPGQISAQVDFKQKFQGDSIEPEGNVRIDLGPQGELLNLYNSYVSQFEIKNERVLSRDQAQLRLLQFLVEIHRKIKLEELPASVPIVWVQGGFAYYADQYRVAGMLIVMDAQTGEILYSRETRNT